MNRIICLILCSLIVGNISAQDNWGKKFEQLGEMLPTPNSYRTGSGSPGKNYWQQMADYKIAVTLDDINQKITGSETITYHNNSPDNLEYLWVANFFINSTIFPILALNRVVLFQI